jgi:nucleoid-associated protein YgaU
VQEALLVQAGFRGQVMQKFWPQETVAQWAVGAIGVVGAASLAYVLVFAPDQAVVEAPVAPPPSVPMLDTQSADAPAPDAPADVQVAALDRLRDTAPLFDIVRVTDLGNVLVAGKAPARVQVSALIDEAQVSQTVSTAAGEFVMMFDVAPSRVPRVLELEVRLPEGGRVRSADTLMLAPSSADALGQGTGGLSARPVQTDPLFAAPPVPEQAETPADTAPPSDGTQVASLPAPVPRVEEPEMSRPPLALLLRADGGVQVLGDAPSLPVAGGAGRNVVIDSVVYDDAGDVVMGGRSGRGLADIQIYLDNQPILRTRADADGAWQAQLAGIERGVYRLRVDELNAAAQVTSRAEIPFERVTPELARSAAGPQALIVQPGNTLWDMSRQKYGDGLRYMRIFEANRDQIRDPDLIYPGQVFVLPEAPLQ